jgi:RNA polymerase sigma factor (TIGR02999 family)
MRRILVESARRKDSLKHGGGRQRADYDVVDPASVERPDELLAVDEALAGLAAVDEQAAELVKLRYFVGMSMPEAAKVIDTPLRSAERLWTFARAWLRRAIERP